MKMPWIEDTAPSEAGGLHNNDYKHQYMTISKETGFTNSRMNVRTSAGPQEGGIVREFEDIDTDG